MAATGYGGHSMVAPLRRVVVRPPSASFGDADPDLWHFSRTPRLELAQAQHLCLVEMLGDAGVEVRVHDAPLPGLADSLFVHDPVLVTDRGTVVLRMGKPLRRGEEEALAATLEEAGVPRLGSVTGDATAEGGDLVWLDRDLLAIGQGFRTNREGFDQLTRILAPLGVGTVAVELPIGDGPDACLHLQSMISLVDERAALVHRRYLSVPFYRLLVELGFEIIEVAEHELGSLGPNVLALAPRVCIALEGNPVTRRRLESRGVEVRILDGSELCLLAEGGPTCLTRPLLRHPLG